MCRSLPPGGIERENVGVSYRFEQLERVCDVDTADISSRRIRILQSFLSRETSQRETFAPHRACIDAVWPKEDVHVVQDIFERLEGGLECGSLDRHKTFFFLYMISSLTSSCSYATPLPTGLLIFASSSGVIGAMTVPVGKRTSVVDRFTVEPDHGKVPPELRLRLLRSGVGRPVDDFVAH